jgi:hypothetical protein
MNEKSNVILPVNYPPITSWQWHATLFSILGNEDLALNWIYSNYIQLRCYPDIDLRFNNSMMILDFMPGDSSLMECPYLMTEIITQKQISYYFNDVLEFFLKTLDLSYYIYGVVDETDMLNRGRRILHQLFIYGYDLEKQVFHVGDFTFAGRYSYTTVSFDNVINGFLKVKPGEDFSLDHSYKDMCCLYLISKNLNSKYYDFDIQLVKRNLNEYLNGYDTKDHYRQKRNPIDTNIFGVNTYSAMIDRIELVEQKAITWYDYRPFHVLYDHKVLMKNRLQYMMDKNYIPFNQDILDEYDMVEKKVLIARNSFIKASVRQDICLEHIKSNLLEAKEKEIEILSNIEKLL